MNSYKIINGKVYKLIFEHETVSEFRDDVYNMLDPIYGIPDKGRILEELNKDGHSLGLYLPTKEGIQYVESLIADLERNKETYEILISVLKANLKLE